MSIDLLKNKSKVFALVDCNNFFVSCEKVFRPELKDKPAVVLSSNDGCIIARSQEVKDMGIKMGTPHFQCRDFLKANNVAIFSSNFALYADMSRRVVQVLRGFSPYFEVYSIDESFLGLEKLAIPNYLNYGIEIRNNVLKSTGIPVSVGIGPTKTLSKFANHLAKKKKEFEGVCDLTSLSNERIDEYLKSFFVGDVWGIGRMTSKFLVEHGIDSALKLKYSDPKWIRKNMGVTGERIVLELNGISCMEVEKKAPKKGITTSRLFGEYIEDIERIKEAVASYTARSAEKLRLQDSFASMIGVYIRTNIHSEKMPQYSNFYWLALPRPTDYTPDLVKFAIKALEKIYVKGYKYQKAGVVLAQITPRKKAYSTSLFNEVNFKTEQNQKNLMGAVDNLNKKFGYRTIYLLGQGLTQEWKAKEAFKSQRFSSHWSDIPVVRI